MDSDFGAAVGAEETRTQALGRRVFGFSGDELMLPVERALILWRNVGGTRAYARRVANVHGRAARAPSVRGRPCMWSAPVGCVWWRVRRRLRATCSAARRGGRNARGCVRGWRSRAGRAARARLSVAAAGSARGHDDGDGGAAIASSRRSLRERSSCHVAADCRVWAELRACV